MKLSYNLQVTQQAGESALPSRLLLLIQPYTEARHDSCKFGVPEPCKFCLLPGPSMFPLCPESCECPSSLKEGIFKFIGNSYTTHLLTMYRDGHLGPSRGHDWLLDILWVWALLGAKVYVFFIVSSAPSMVPSTQQTLSVLFVECTGKFCN